MRCLGHSPSAIAPARSSAEPRQARRGCLRSAAAGQLEVDHGGGAARICATRGSGVGCRPRILQRRPREAIEEYVRELECTYNRGPDQNFNYGHYSPAEEADGPDENFNHGAASTDPPEDASSSTGQALHGHYLSAGVPWSLARQRSSSGRHDRRTRSPHPRRPAKRSSGCVQAHRKPPRTAGAP
jgi:hypothetical protein